MDINGIRTDTVGAAHVVHFNNAGSSLMPLTVYEKITNYMQEEFEHGGYEIAAKYEPQLEGTYEVIAKFINADSSEIAYLENATAAWDAVFHAVDFRSGDEILTGESEYASNFIALLQVKKRYQVEIRVIPNGDDGAVSLDALTNMISSRTRLISLVHIPTNGGLVNPAEEIGRIARQHEVLYLLDACQSVGQYPVDVKTLGCHFLSATGRKYLRGPRGCGFLYVERNLIDKLEPYALDLHSAEWGGPDSYKIRDDARRFENWESNLAVKLGLKTAVEYAHEIGVENSWQRISQLAKVMRETFATIPGLTIRDQGTVKCGIVTFTINDIQPEEIKRHLTGNGINVSITTRSSTLLDMDSRGLDAMIRASVHYYNTEEEIVFCKEKLSALVD